ERPPPECPQSWSTIHDYEIHGSTWWTIWVRFVQLVHLVENRVQRIAATAHARDPAAGTCDALTRGATPGAARPPHRGNTEQLQLDDRVRGLAHADPQAALQGRRQPAVLEHLQKRRFRRDRERLIGALDRGLEVRRNETVVVGAAGRERERRGQVLRERARAQRERRRGGPVRR